MREQSGGSNRRESRSSWPNLRNESEDDDVQEISKRDLERESSEPDWSKKPIPKKKNVKQFGLKEANKEKDDKRSQDDKTTKSWYSIDSSPHDKCNTSGKNVKSTPIDLCCSDGETDPEDVDAGQSKYFARSRSTRKSIEVDQPAENLSRKSKKDEKKIAETLAAINEEVFIVPQKPLGLFKAPSSSEGRKLTKAVALADKTTATERKSPVRRVLDSLTRPFKLKKSANAGKPILPGASLQSNNLQARSDRSLESNSKGNRNGDSLESNKSFATPSKVLLEVDSSDDDCDFQSNWRSNDKPAAKKTNKSYDEDFSYDDFSSANSLSVAKKRKNSSSRERETSSSLSYRTTRSSARKSSMKGKTNEVVDMLDDSDDEENTLACFDIARIAIGSSVKQHNCQIKIFSGGILSCSYSVRSKEKVHNINFEGGEVEEAYYFIDNTVDITGRLPSDDAIEPGSFIALRAQKTKSNGFSSVSSYEPGDSTAEKGFIVAEFRSDADLATFISVVKENQHLAAFFSNDNRLARDRADLISNALVADAKKEALNRNKKVKSSDRVGFLAGKLNTDLLLRFPFGGDPSLIDAAADGLAEFQCPKCNDENEEERDTALYENASSELCAPDGSEDTRRRHHVEIRVEDFERLDPGVYLNDTLIDFFLQWMTRKHTSQDLHVFTTHFYTALEDNGAEGVSSWTTKKKIDVFKLRFIYIPINKALHWSFCVVVNPGFILQQKGRTPDGNEPMPCLLFFDSLKMHQKDRVHGNVMKWLNAEWMRLKSSSSGPFEKASFPVLTPKVTYQDNSWDCGVFVCRYASGIFQLRNRVFSHNDLAVDRNVINMITYGDEFKFTLEDIADLREQMKILIERLSDIYLPWKKKTDQEERLKRLAEAKSEPNANSLESGTKSSVEEITDMPPLFPEKRKVPDSPESLATQKDFDEFDEQTTKENVDFGSNKSREMVDVSKDYGMSYVDESHWRYCADEQPTDAASV